MTEQLWNISQQGNARPLSSNYYLHQTAMHPWSPCIFPIEYIRDQLRRHVEQYETRGKLAATMSTKLNVCDILNSMAEQPWNVSHEGNAWPLSSNYCLHQTTMHPWSPCMLPIEYICDQLRRHFEHYSILVKLEARLMQLRKEI